MRHQWTFFLAVFLVRAAPHGADPTLKYVPCIEVARELKFPCRCALGAPEKELDGDPAVSVDCDGVVFAGDVPSIPYGAPIVSYSQRWSGHQALPPQLFGTLGLPLRRVDLSGNLLRRLTERLLHGLQASLLELRLADNLLGDNLNPIFSSNEFHGLRNLKILDLGGNKIRSLEEGIFEGCENLSELHLDNNNFAGVPSASLNGPKYLRVLSLENNRIEHLKQGAFQRQRSLTHINLSHNSISNIEAGTFAELSKLESLQLGHNRLTKFNSDVFQGAPNLQLMDLSENFISEFPTIALKLFTQMRHLNLSSNLIQNLDNNNLETFANLQELDLSRNSISNIVPGTFLGLKQLRRLDISVNSLRTVEDDAFEGLDNLHELVLKDNNILLIPASAIGRLPRLNFLQLDYNRVAALSSDLLRSAAEQVTTLVIAKNVVRELPPATFQHFVRLQNLDLNRNLISVLNSDAFVGLENTLRSLHLSQNKINSLTGSPLLLNKLELLDLSDNQLMDLSRNAFSQVPNLRHLNMSRNIHLSNLPVTILHKCPKIATVDLSYTSLRVITGNFFVKAPNIEHVDLSNNEIPEISENFFVNMYNLTTVDLSYNKIANVKHGAFVNVMNIKNLYLNKNLLTSFKGEFFNTGTGLEVIDISDNQLSYLFPSSFRIHPRLREIRASRNRFTFFPAELISNLQFLENVDLSNNGLKTVDELDFAKLPRLHTLVLSDNNLDSVSEMSFHNSTQLQNLDLSHNKLERVGERIFEGLIRLKHLNLEGNLLTDLPETVFDRSRLQMLENINLANNLFETAPLKALQRQYFFVSSVDLSKNLIKDIPADDSTMVNIKKLDLSYNPLTEQSIVNILNEPKTVRELNLAGTGIASVTRLETPFLHLLNLSNNNISDVSREHFERTTLLESLDLSNNKILELSSFPKIWSVLKNLRRVDLSGNPIDSISRRDFEGLESLREANLQDLTECARIEKNAFESTPNLAILNAYNYPKLGYLDIKGILEYLPVLERLNVETKDLAIGSDHLGAVLHPRLLELGLRGSRLQSISSGLLSGIKGPEVLIRLQNTSLNALPPTLFFPVPRSSKITLNVDGSKLTTISPQLLSTLDDRRGDLKIVGLETNPIVCDCGARALRRWLPAHMTSIRCSGPEALQGQLLVEIGDDELTCDLRKQTTGSPSSSPASTHHNHHHSSRGSTRHAPKTTEPEIIWSLASSEKPQVKSKTPSSKVSKVNSASIGNDDTLIIGIVGGVVAFIVILIIIICIIRLRMSQNQYRGGPLATGAGGASMIPHAGLGTNGCACGTLKSGAGSGAPPMYAVSPPYHMSGSFASTLPHKMSAQNHIRANYSTMGRAPYYQNSPQPYYVAFPPDEKMSFR